MNTKCGFDVSYRLRGRVLILDERSTRLYAAYEAVRREVHADADLLASTLGCSVDIFDSAEQVVMATVAAPVRR